MTAEVTGRLSDIERDRLAHEEAVIASGRDTFIAVGTALATVRDGRLYRGTHDTFANYCSERWGFSRQRAQQMIGAADVSTVVDVANEAQARALSGLAPDEQRATYDRARQQSGSEQPTAAQIKAARPSPPGTDDTPPPGAGSEGEADLASERDPAPDPDSPPEPGAGAGESHDSGEAGGPSDPLADAKAAAKRAPASIGAALTERLEEVHRDLLRAGGPSAIVADTDDLPGGDWFGDLTVDTLDRLIPLLTEWRRQLRRANSSLRGVK